MVIVGDGACGKTCLLIVFRKLVTLINNMKLIILLRYLNQIILTANTKNVLKSLT